MNLPSGLRELARYISTIRGPTSKARYPRRDDPDPVPRHPVLARNLIGWLPAIAWATGIFVLSAQQDLVFVPDRGLDLVVRKIGHAVVFAILGLLIWRALATMTPVARSTTAFLLAVGYAATDELHQAYVATRHASVVDVVIDAAGVVIGIAVLVAYRSRQFRLAGRRPAGAVEAATGRCREGRRGWFGRGS